MMCRFASMKAGYASTTAGPTVQSTSAPLVSSIAAIRFQRRRLHAVRRLAEQLLPRREVHAVCVGEVARAVREPDDGDVEAARQQVLALLMQLPQHRAADVADADEREGELRPRLEEGLMNRVQRTPLLRRVDDAGDVPLRRPLCD